MSTLYFYFSTIKDIISLMKKNKSVLVSLSGGIKSLVAAYILKKQGHQVSGALIEIPSLDGESYSLKSTCHQNDDEKVKKYCELLEIPCIGIDGTDLYNQFVVERLIAARLAGEAFTPCVYCNQIRAEILLSKANELNIDFIATGHLAQVTKSLNKNSYMISQALDSDNDQSYFLTRLDNITLERMLFPLGKLSLSEILKIGKSLIGKKADGSAKKICLMDEGLLPSFIASKTPEKLRQSGTLLEYASNLPLGEHDGLYHYHVGQDHIKCNFNEVDSSFEIVKMNPDKKEIFVAKKWKHEIRYLTLKDFIHVVDLDLSRPIRCQVIIDPNTKNKLPGILFFNNNDEVHLELDKPITKPVEKNTHMVFYLNNKVLGSAVLIEGFKKSPPFAETFYL